MQPHSQLVDTYIGLVDRGKKVADGFLYRIPIYTSDSRPEAVKTAANAWIPAPGALETIRITLAAFAEGIFAIRSDQSLTEAAKASRVAALETSARAGLDRQAGIVRSAITKVLETLRASAYPARPTPQDAAQEAALAGIKADIQMVFAAMDAPAEIFNSMASRLSRAISDNDKLATWLLAASRWPEDYFASRRMPEYVEAWGDQVASVLDISAPADLDDVRSAYRRLSDGRNGLFMIETVLTALLPQIIAETASWRPTYGSDSRPMGAQFIDVN
jgi:hypothetical protein